MRQVVPDTQYNATESGKACGRFVYENGKLSFIINADGVVRAVYGTPGGGTVQINPEMGITIMPADGGEVLSGFTREIHLKDHLGNVRAVFDYSKLQSENHYYPFGLPIHNLCASTAPEGKENRYLYNGKELQDDLGLNWMDYGWRMYDPTIGRFHTLDRYKENFNSWSPYHYANNNPILNIDIMGDSTVVSGAESAAAVQQLQDATSTELTISQNTSGTLNVTHTGMGPISPDAQQVLDAANSSTITVNVVAENTKITSTGNLYIGGAFMGNTVTQTANGNTVVASQEVNPQVLGAMSSAHGKPGADMMHEVTEAYQGAEMSQTSGVSSPMSNQPGSVYKQAHNSATPQSGAVYETVYDANNKVINTYNGAARVEYSVRPVGGSAPLIIMRFP